MLTSGGRCRVADLGLARVGGPESGLAVTMTGMVMGTPLYMPGAAQGRREVDYRADFYASATALTTSPPAGLPTEAHRAWKVIASTSTRRCPTRGRRTPELEPAVRRAAQEPDGQRPEDRPQAHAEIERELDPGAGASGGGFEGDVRISGQREAALGGSARCGTSR